MKVYALVGKSGTGKSFQSLNVCREKKIEAIIDDGLFIYRNAEAAGSSAKKEKTMIGAIKKAIFKDPAHCKAVKNAIREKNPEKILIIGTSEEMVAQIAQRLELPDIDEIIHIEDITTEKERKIARIQRDTWGNHVIPVPTVEIKQEFSGYLMDTVRHWAGLGVKAEKMEKTIVRPAYSYLGAVDVSPSVVPSLVAYAAKEIPEVSGIVKTVVKDTSSGTVINVLAEIRYGTSVLMVCERMQQILASRVSAFMAKNIVAVNVTVQFSK